MNGREPFPDLVMRPVDTNDLAAIIDAFRRLSPGSFYHRFFTITPDPTTLVTSHVARVGDRDHRALVVLDGDRVVATAQWDRARLNPEEAEIAVTVDDAWQHRGLGRVLTRALASDAHGHGIATLSASVLAENHPARALALRNGPTTVSTDGPWARYTFKLAS